MKAYSYITACFLLSLLLANSIAAQTHTFLIQDKWGVITGVSVSPTGIASEPEVVRGMLGSPYPLLFVDLEANSTGGIQLTSGSAIIPIGNAKMPVPIWSPSGEAICFTVAPGGAGAWIATGDSIKVVGRAPQLVFPLPVEQNKPIMDLEYDPSGNRLIVLFGDGSLAICYSSQYEIDQTLALDDDVALDVEISSIGIYILTRNAKLYLLQPDQLHEVSGMPELGEGLACDFELSPFGDGFYILDIFGVVHACNGAPNVPTAPLSQDSAVDLEIIPLAKPPEWFPYGWNSQVQLNPQELLMDPSGPSKTVSLQIENAENLSGFVAEIKYDPKVLKIDPKVRLGRWWEENIQGAQVVITPDAATGSLILYGGGTFLPFTGASGNGELVRFSVTPQSDIKSASSSIELVNFFFPDSNIIGFRGSYPNFYHTAKIVQSVSVTIQTLQPKAFLTWDQSMQINEDSSQTFRLGEVVRVDLMLEHGISVQEITFSFTFPKNLLQFLGMTPGQVWNEDIPVIPLFDIPAVANKQGGLDNQVIHTATPGSFQSDQGSLVALFFAVSRPGDGAIDLVDLTIQDGTGQNIPVEVIRKKLLFSCP